MMWRIAEEIQGSEGQFPVHLESTCWFVVSMKFPLRIRLGIIYVNITQLWDERQAFRK